MTPDQHRRMNVTGEVGSEGGSRGPDTRSAPDTPVTTGSEATSSVQALRADAAPEPDEIERDDVRSNAIERRAYELYLERGGADGSDIDDWVRAERELAASAPRQSEDVVTENTIARSNDRSGPLDGSTSGTIGGGGAATGGPTERPDRPEMPAPDRDDVKRGPTEPDPLSVTMPPDNLKPGRTDVSRR